MTHLSNDGRPPLVCTTTGSPGLMPWSGSVPNPRTAVLSATQPVVPGAHNSVRYVEAPTPATASVFSDPRENGRPVAETRAPEASTGSRYAS